MVKGFRQLREFSAFLLAGTVLALVWANLDPGSYTSFIDDALVNEGDLLWPVAELFAHGKAFSFHFIVNDMFMVLFFGIAGKEVSESFLPGGALSSLKKAAMPAVATAGGVIGPVAVFLGLAFAMGIPTEVINGAWAVPTATDIAYCWLFAGLIFGRAHPAVTFLLVLAVLDDLIGMLIIAVYYTPEVHIEWLGLLALAIVVCELMRRFGVKSYWPYVVIGGTLSWFGLHNTGVHAALALVPIVPFMPHAERDAGLFELRDEHGDTMHDFEHFFAPIVDVGLFTFGLANAGVVLSTESFMGSTTWAILLALLLGKTFGIFGFAWIGSKFGLDLPKPMTMPQTIVLGCVAGIGFTVALFVTTVAVQVMEIPQNYADMLKLGALLSFAAGPIAYLISRLMKVERIDTDTPAQTHH
ncbi:MAG: Na+/H+ antiporter NhaA [Myxococcota bacterium]